MSMEILVPVRPRNCESAEVRYVRAVRGSRGSLLVLFVGGWLVEWVILYFINWLLDIARSFEL